MAKWCMREMLQGPQLQFHKAVRRRWLLISDCGVLSLGMDKEAKDVELGKNTVDCCPNAIWCFATDPVAKSGIYAPR